MTSPVEQRRSSYHDIPALRPTRTPASTTPSSPDNSQPPQTDLSRVKGRGEEGDKRFRTIALSAAVRVLKPAPFQLLAYLMLRGDADGGSSFPSRRTIARDLSWHTDRVARWMKELADAGWVERIAFVDEDGRAVSSLYRFRTPRSLPEDGGLEGAVNWSKRKAGFEPRDRG